MRTKSPKKTKIGEENKMAKGKNQKVKLLKILEILRNESDEQHPMATKTLIERLNEEGIDIERKTLYDDIACLNECGYEIMSIKTNSNNYYIEDRTFDVAEIKILLDAVNAAHFITEKKTKQLSEKIAALSGNHRAKLMKRHVLVVDPKHSNEKIYYNVDCLNECIERGKKVAFRYFDYDLSGRVKYRKDGEKYLVTPIRLVFSEDNYYLVAYSDKHDDLANYRVDRMDGVTASEENAVAKGRKRGLTEKENRRMFSMFKGKPSEITLLCDMSLINAVVDKFGEGAIMTKHGEDKFTVNATVELAPTFYSWVFTFGNQMKILSPAFAVDEMKNLVDDVRSLY